MEKDLLEKLNIPSLNLEIMGCPKYDVLRIQSDSLLPSCGFTKVIPFIIVPSLNVTRFGNGTNRCLIKSV